MTDPIAAFRASERALLAHHAVRTEERVLELTAPRMRARVLETGTGTPTLFVHGGGAFGALWAPLVAELPARRCLMIDRPGFGLSDFVPIGTSLRAHAVEFLASTLDALALDRVDIVASSMGALWSLWLALDRPERVRSLALLGAPAMVGGKSAPLPMRLLGRPLIGALMMKLEAPSPAQVRVLWQRMGHDPEALSGPIHAAMLAAENVPAYGPAWRALLGAALTLTGPAPGIALSDAALGDVRCPVSYVWGSNDPFADLDVGRAVAKSTSGSPLTVAGTGHLPWLDDPRGCAAACERVVAVRAAA